MRNQRAKPTLLTQCPCFIPALKMPNVNGNIGGRAPIATGTVPDDSSTRWRYVGEPLDDTTTKASNPAKPPKGSSNIQKVKNTFKFVREEVSLLRGKCKRWWKQDRPFLVSDLRHDVPEFLVWTWNNVSRSVKEKKVSLAQRMKGNRPEQNASARRKPARLQKKRKD
jgi:hypothetical protein